MKRQTYLKRVTSSGIVSDLLNIVPAVTESGLGAVMEPQQQTSASQNITDNVPSYIVQKTSG